MNALHRKLLLVCGGLLLSLSAVLRAGDVPSAASLMADLESNDDLRRLENAVREAETGKDMMKAAKADRKSQKEIKKQLKDLERDLAKLKREVKRRNEPISRLAKEVEKSGNIDMKDGQGRTLAMLVAECNCTSAMEKVLAAGPKLNIRDKDGRTALDYERRAMGYALARLLQQQWEDAVTNVDGAAIKYLLECGLSPDVAVMGEPPLGYAIKSGKKEVVDALLAVRPSVKKRMADGTSMLEQAIISDMAEAIRYLTANGCDVNERMRNGEHPFFRLVTRGGAEAVRAWMDSVSNMDLQQLPSTNPACVAARCGTPENLAAVLDSRADLLNSPDDYGNTPLMEAARRGSAEMVADLIKRGAKVDAVTKRKETPLMGAALSGSAEVVSALLKAAPALRDAKDAAGKTADWYAEQSGSSEAVRALAGGNAQ
ncbi:MAG: ankyrin repeat domain-containing protein [Akkermansia sp.]